MYASKNGNDALLSFLLHHGADINIQDRVLITTNII